MQLTWLLLFLFESCKLSCRTTSNLPLLDCEQYHSVVAKFLRIVGETFFIIGTCKAFQDLFRKKHKVNGFGKPLKKAYSMLITWIAATCWNNSKNLKKIVLNHYARFSTTYSVTFGKQKYQSCNKSKRGEDSATYGKSSKENMLA